MRTEGTVLLARIYVGESDQWDGRPLYEAIVHALRERKIAGATVIRGIQGFRAKGHLRTARIFRLSEDRPVIIEAVDREEHIRAALESLDAMMDDGLITLAQVDALVADTNG